MIVFLTLTWFYYLEQEWENLGSGSRDECMVTVTDYSENWCDIMK
jgi:hypothetical protein